MSFILAEREVDMRGAMDEGAAACASGLMLVDGIKGRLTTLCTHEAELGVELCELEAQHAMKMQATHKEAVQQVTAKRDAVRAAIKATENELDEAVNAPVSGGRDPTEWLPDELMLMVLERVPFATLWSGACERVCQRWFRVMKSDSIARRKRDGRWSAYDVGAIKPRRLEGHTGDVYALAIGLDGRVYSGSEDKTIKVWSSESGAHLQTLQPHNVRSLAIGLDGAIYSGAWDCTVKAWSGASGEHVRTLEGHTCCVFALAVGLDSKIYSGSADDTIRVWSGDDGTHLKTLVGHTGWVRALAVGKDGAIYSGSNDGTIRVWSGEDGAHLRTLVGPPCSVVVSLAAAPDGRLYSGLVDSTIQVWSPDDGVHLQALVGHTEPVWTIVVSPDGKVFSGSGDGTVRVWSGVDGAHLHALEYPATEVCALAFDHNGNLYSGGTASNGVHMAMW